MGLYDNYKLSNSTSVPQFAGSIVPDLKLAKDQADSRYEQSQEGLINLPEVLNQAPVNDMDKDTWAAINNEAQQKISSWAQRKDLENATIDIYRYSKQVGNKLKTLADRKKARDEYVSSIEKREDLTPDIKKFRIEQADANSGQARFGPDGRLVNQYNGTTPAKQVDKAKLVREALAMIEPDGSAEVLGYDQDNHRYSIKTSKGTQWVDETKVLNTLASAKQLNPEWLASDEQEHDSKLYHSTKGITDDVVLSQIANNPTNPEMLEVKRLMERQGYPASVAYKQVKSDKIKYNLDAAEKQYARSKVFTRTNTGEDVGIGPNWVSDRQQMQDEIQKAAATAGTQMPWIRGGDLIPTLNEESNMKTVEETVKQNSTKATQIATELQSVEKQITETADPRVKSSLLARKASLVSEQEAMIMTNNSYTDRLNFVKQQAAKDLHLDLSKVKELEKARVLKLMGNKTVAGLSQEEIATAFAEGKIERKVPEDITDANMSMSGGPTEYYLIKPDGSKVNLKNLAEPSKLTAIFTPTNDFGRIIAKATTNWRNYNKNYSQSVPGFMPAPDKEGKVFKEGLESVINSRGSSLKLKIPGKFEEIPSSEIPKDATWDVIDVAPSGKGEESKVRVRELVDGKPTGNIYDAYMSINIYDQLAQLYGSNHSDPNIRTMVKAFRSGSGYRTLTSMPNNSTILKGKGSQFVIQDGLYKLIDDTGNVIEKEYKNADGSTFKKKFETTDAYEAGEWYESLKK
jgi:hypothetical protein